MKLHAGTHNIEKSGNFEESKFSIEASSKAFFILSDGLYSNKILAVVRELSTNAYDSHVAADKKHVPFDVHLPTVLEPFFFIRDYGTSMNHEDCMQLYTTYFRSTRNNSNDAVGCLGLGSKAPFAYSDSFTVEAYLNGTKRIYNAFKDENGSPVFSLMHEDATDEVDGIKVCIQVNSGDVHRFLIEAKNVYEFFNVKPNFVGETLNFNKETKILSGDSWYFSDDDSSNLIIMGQIAYPIDHYQLMNNESNKEAQFIQNSDGLRVFVKIGDVDITPSRESLSYSKETKANIKTMINNIASEIAQKIESEIATQPTLYKARMKFVQISEQCGTISNAIESLQKSIVWNDLKLFDNPITDSVNIKNKIEVTHLHKSSYRKKVDSSKDIEAIMFKTSTKFVVDDIKRGGLSRIKQSMRKAYDEKNYYVYKLRDGETVDNCVLYAILGGATKEDVVLASSFPKISYNRQSSGGSDGPAIQVQVYNEETGSFECCNMSVKYENAYYFAESKGEITIGHRTVTIDFMQNALGYMHKNYPNEIDGMTFYAVKPSVIKNRKLDERDNWNDASRVVHNIFTKAFEENEKDVMNCQYHYSLSDKRYDKFKHVFAETQTDNEAKKIVTEYNEYAERISKIRHEMDIIRIFANIFILSSNSKNYQFDKSKFSKRFDAAVSKYPMLKVLANHGYYGGISNEDTKIMVEYVDSIENNVEVNA
jgi:hypothetical protein